MFAATTSPWYLPTWVSSRTPVTSPMAHSRSPARRRASTGMPRESAWTPTLSRPRPSPRARHPPRPRSAGPGGRPGAGAGRPAARAGGGPPATAPAPPRPAAPPGAPQQADALPRQPALRAGVGVARDHEVPPGQRRLHVDLCARRRLPGVVGGLAGAQQRLGRDARPVGALAPDQLPLDEGNPQAALGQLPPPVLARRAAAYDDDVVIAAHDVPPARVRGAWKP